MRNEIAIIEYAHEKIGEILSDLLKHDNGLKMQNFILAGILASHAFASEQDSDALLRSIFGRAKHMLDSFEQPWSKDTTT